MIMFSEAVILLIASTSVFGQSAISVATSSATVSGSSTTAPSPACLCNDEPPPAAENQPQFTCKEQKEFGKCDADFMLGYCECTCGRCCPCNDFPPTAEEFTCQQQKEFGKCGEDFLSGFCECTCDRCSAPIDGPVSTPAPTNNGCSGGEVLIFGSGGCETVRCAQNRQRCANTCGGLTLIKFDCEDVTNGGSSAFSSSCACV